ncbi:hypothetical protein BDV93DRAFT_511331 [Ceratobasidium sp. AG-I]|nr:hypothetical protein BDV93DRAFT_511331 [Ceratobasidium sp. AG-I]
MGLLRRCVNRAIAFFAIFLLFVLLLIVLVDPAYERGELINTRDPGLSPELRLLAPCVPKRMLVKDKRVDGGGSFKDRLKRCGVIISRPYSENARIISYFMLGAGADMQRYADRDVPLPHVYPSSTPPSRGYEM